MLTCTHTRHFVGSNYLDYIHSETKVVQSKSIITTLGVLFNVISLVSFPDSCLVHKTLHSFITN